jgi:NADH-quinone oxidoreductase subunit C
MDSKEFVQHIEERFASVISGIDIKSPVRGTITIDRDAVVDVSKYLFHYLKFRFIIASALDTKNGFEIYYHFGYDQSGLIMNLRVKVPHDKPEIESLTGIFEAANWIEREMHELFGIQFLNHPNLEKLISEGNWAEGVYPYRKEWNKEKVE